MSGERGLMVTLRRTLGYEQKTWFSDRQVRDIVLHKYCSCWFCDKSRGTFIYQRGARSTTKLSFI